MMDETTIASKAEASISPPSERKCTVCEGLDVWPEPPLYEHRYKPSTKIDFKDLIDGCGYCQLIKHSIIKLNGVPPDNALFFVRTDNGLIRVTGGGFDGYPSWQFMIYTPNQVRTFVGCGTLGC
jgi:hypothetical protein